MEPSPPNDGGGLFDRPLWRLWIPMLLVPVALQRAVVAYMVAAGGAGTAWGVFYALQAVGLIVVAVWIFAGWPPVPSSSEE